MPQKPGMPLRVRALTPVKGDNYRPLINLTQDYGDNYLDSSRLAV